MKFSSYHGGGRRKGVSEVLGALLLIIVVIVAVTALSIFLSRAQTNAENRQNYLTSVQNENLQFSEAQFGPGNPNVQWELDSLSPSNVRYYVAMNPESLTSVFLNPNGTASDMLVTLENSGMGPNSGNLNEISKGVQADYTGSALVFGSGTPNYVFEPATWNNVTLTIRNLNTADSGLTQLQVGDVWLRNWSEVNQAGQILGSFSSGGIPLDIPARGSVDVFVSLADSGISLTKNSSTSVKMITQLGNIFSTSYATPVPVAKGGTTTENYVVANRDVVTLDGSGSYSQSTTIQEYLWSVSVPIEANQYHCTDAAFQNPTNYNTAYVFGETIQYTPESLFPQGLGSDCITGPIQVTLTVVDDNGFTSSSQYLVIPPDPNIAPPAALSEDVGMTSCTPPPGPGTGTAWVYVTNIFGNLTGGVPVVAFASGGVSLSLGQPSENATSTSGLQFGYAAYNISCSGPGTLEITSGTLPPVTIQIT